MCDSQYGFWKCSSTKLAATLQGDDIGQAIDGG